MRVRAQPLIASTVSPSSRLSARPRIMSGGPIPVRLLRQDDQVGAGRRRAGDEALRALDVLRLRVGGVQLDTGHAKPVGHGLRIAWEGECAPLRRSSPRRRRSPSSAPRRGPKGRATASCATCSPRATGSSCAPAPHGDPRDPLRGLRCGHRGAGRPRGRLPPRGVLPRSGRAGGGCGREGALAPARHRLAEARAIAERAGMDYVENACTAVVHSLCISPTASPTRRPLSFRSSSPG